jgi:hypothetical protein
MRRPIETVVDDAIKDPDGILADVGLDPSNKMQVLTEHRRLLEIVLIRPCSEWRTDFLPG